MKKKRDGCSSRYKGVSYDKRNRKWKAQLVYKKKHINIGLYLSEEKARLAFMQAIVDNHLEEFYPPDCVTSPN